MRKPQQHPEINIIINTTPAGMYPNNGSCLLDLHAFPKLEAVLDCVYNPFRTELCSCGGTWRARLLWVRDAGGAGSVRGGALYRPKLPEAVIADTHRKLKRDLSNVAITNAGLRQVHHRACLGQNAGQNLCGSG